MFNFLNPYWFPKFPTICDKPMTLYSIMNSIVNYGKEEQTKIKDLAKDSRETIFDFKYPLSSKIDKAEFETNILKHFIQRRIGCETFTAWQIELDSKLNEIMPKYNIMFDSLSNWDLFKDGLKIEKIGHVEDKGNSNSKTSANIDTSSETKMRHSDLPQSRLQDIDDEEYVNIYEKNNGTNNSKSNSENTTNDNKLNDYNETIKHSQENLVELYINFQNNIASIYSMIYKDLECLFYGLL